MSGNNLWQKLPKDEKFRRELWLVVSRLKELQLSYGQSFTADTYEIDGLKPGVVISKLRILDKQGVLDYQPPDMSFMLEGNYEPLYDEHPRVVNITLHDLFNSLYAEFEKKPIASQREIGEKIKVQLIRNDRFLVLSTGEVTKTIKKFNPDTQVAELVNYLVNNRPNKPVSIYDLRNAPGLHLASLDDIAETLRKAGLKPLQPYFIKEWNKTSARVDTEADMTQQEFESLVATMTAKNRQK